MLKKLKKEGLKFHRCVSIGKWEALGCRAKEMGRDENAGSCEISWRFTSQIKSNFPIIIWKGIHCYTCA